MKDQTILLWFLAGLVLSPIVGSLSLAAWYLLLDAVYYCRHRRKTPS